MEATNRGMALSLLAAGLELAVLPLLRRVVV
jgi:hypothetical protein